MDNIEKMLDELNELLENTSANSIRKSVTQVYLDYVLKNHQILPLEFKTIASDFNYLIDFLEKMEEINCSKSSEQEN